MGSSQVSDPLIELLSKLRSDFTTQQNRAYFETLESRLRAIASPAAQAQQANSGTRQLIAITEEVTAPFELTMDSTTMTVDGTYTTI